MSLKDLLERGWPAQSEDEVLQKKEIDNSPKPDGEDKTSPSEQRSARIGRGAGGSFGGRSGYSILRSLTQMDGERCILPIVQDVAEGLSILHRPGFRHQDIKPANVLVRQVGMEIQAAVADLGFIDQGDWQAHGSAIQNRPIGTRHYRSPEQTDAFDVCEVDVHCNEDGGYTLTTRDPKFLRTFSEEGDFVVFAKLRERTQWEISNIKFPEKENDNGEVREPIEITIRPLENVSLQPDQRTQISVHKKQTARTDLFGLGAIIYDMLTCGRSPEQFYDLLRAHDRPNENIKEGLAQRYLHFRNGGGTVPEIDAIFQNLRVSTGSEFPSQGIVNIILRCMMSRPKDSYFKEENRERIWDSVKTDLSALAEEAPESYRLTKNNYLTSPEAVRQTTEGERAPGPLETLRSIQSLDYGTPASVAERLIRGPRFFVKVANMIGAELRGGPDFSYLVDVSPRNLDERRGQFVPKFAFFERKEDIHGLLTSRNPRFVLQTFSAGNLLPPFMRALSRECYVWRRESQHANNGSPGAEVIYDPWDTDYGWSELSKGDRLSIELSPTETAFGVIEAHEGTRLLLSEISENALERMEAWRRYRSIVVREFAPSDYYVAMLGIYLRLIFFVDPNDKREGTPSSVYCLEQIAKYLPNRTFGQSETEGATRDLGILNFIGLGDIGKKRDESVAPEKIFEFLAEFYLRLVTRRVFDSLEAQQSPSKPRIAGYSRPAENAATVVANVVAKFGSEMEKLLDCSEGHLLSAAQEEVERSVAERIRGSSEFPQIFGLTEKLVREWTVR